MKIAKSVTDNWKKQEERNQDKQNGTVRGLTTGNTYSAGKAQQLLDIGRKNMGLEGLYQRTTPVNYVYPGDGTNDDVTWTGDEWYDNALAQQMGADYDASVLAGTVGYDSTGVAKKWSDEKEAVPTETASTADGTEKAETDNAKSSTGFYSGYTEEDLKRMYGDASKKGQDGEGNTTASGKNAGTDSESVKSGNGTLAEGSQATNQAEYSIQALQDYFSGGTNTGTGTGTTGGYSYNLEADPIYQQYAKMYLNNGQRAMEDTIGTASSLTGGYGNSYAQTAGQQIYNQYVQELGNVGLQLEQQAYSRYRDTVSDSQWQQSFDYQKERDSVSDSQWQQSFEYQKAQDAITEAMNRESQYQSAVNQDIARSQDALTLANTLASSGYTADMIQSALQGVYGASVDDTTIAKYAQDAYDSYEQQYLQSLLLSYASGSGSTGTSTGTSSANYTTSDYKNVEAMASAYAGDPTALGAYLTDMLTAGKISSDYANSLYSRYYYGDTGTSTGSVSSTGGTSTGTSTKSNYSSSNVKAVEEAVADMIARGATYDEVYYYVAGQASAGVINEYDGMRILQNNYTPVYEESDDTRVTEFINNIPKAIETVATYDGDGEPYDYYVYNGTRYEVYNEAINAMVDDWTAKGKINSQDADAIRYTKGIAKDDKGTSPSVIGYETKQAKEETNTKPEKEAESVPNVTNIVNEIEAWIEGQETLTGKRPSDTEIKTRLNVYSENLTETQYNSILEDLGVYTEKDLSNYW